MGKLWRICILLAMLMLVCIAPPCAALTIEPALENPVNLVHVGDAPLAYIFYSADQEEFLAAYTEYDAYAEGYGGFIIRYGSEANETILTAVIAKEIEDIGLGVAIHWMTDSTPAWLLDLGASYRIGPLGFRIGIHDVPFTKWKDMTEDSYFSAGASLDLSENISMGIDTRFLEEPLYKGHVRLGIRPDLEAQVYALYQGSSWDAVGVDAWLSRGALLFRVGYKMDWDRESCFCVGIGLRL
ncbi:MAG: hypothetical protein GX998_07425 [Firmicutes bacterium]|nr:hypothetical protein [Bacillota bacterium]